MMSIKKTLFAVDDDEGMRLIYSDIFSDNYEIYCYESGVALLQMVDNIKPDLVIIDIGLGDMDGYELCSELKLKNGMEDIPVIFVTARDFSEDKGRAFFSGGTEYVTKPLEEEQFHSIVERLLDHHRVG